MLSTRNGRGQAVLTLTLLIAFFIILIAGLFAFEVNRAEVARQQLQAACDAAALAGAATLASQDDTDPIAAHTDAMSTALNTFQQNSVVGYPLSTGSLVVTNEDSPTSLQSSIYVEFLNPRDDNAVVTLGDPNGKVMKVTGAFGLEPTFGKLLGIDHVTVRAASSGGVPQMDIALCFDVSGSIDDQTPVTFVRRRWDAAGNRIAYDIPATRPGSLAGPIAEGTIYNILVPPATGSPVNALFPQQLSQATIGHSATLRFSEVPTWRGSSVGLRGTREVGAPPGNADAGSGTGDANTFTDLVVNIDGNNHFSGITSGAYPFPDLATLVEAARGNLESPDVFTSSRANLSVPSSIVPRAGYQAEYRRLAMHNIHPLSDAQTASEVFLQIMNTNTDAHFTLVTFSTNAGTDENTRFGPIQNVDTYYNAGGTGSHPQMLIPLSNAVNNTKFDASVAALPTTVATGGTNIGEAVERACDQLTRNGRPGSKKAIVLFTDGQPTQPLVDPWGSARRAATVARDNGYAIYTIGLAQTPAIVEGEVAILNDTNPNPTTGGIAAIAGHGGKFFLVTDARDLRATFENIARNLVQLVK